MPKEETFLVPLKYIDVTRNTHTSFDVSLKKNIDDYWNVDGESVNSTPTITARTELHSMITFHHANTRGSRAARSGFHSFVS